ncbi:hypothetical protein GCM10008938_35600 [Deinococcus roseus]|uniref:Uncharacterized protein n=1 Tax=Deinococcus roseus TaxID=392414 RepID=A0ABQ2D7J9_9DEIO|nr:hypothetical protein GCM10008938_35600 [Deinococcus roseus]
MYCALPLYHALVKAGKQVHLANLSFTALGMTGAREIHPTLFEVTRRTPAELRYFPEVYLSQFLHLQGFNSSVFAFEKRGYRQLQDGYQYLVDALNVDTVVLVDGGTDSLMRGDEDGLGTPEEDAISLAAVWDLENVKQKLLACIGFGIDAFHGVCHAHFLESVAALTRSGHSLGTFSLQVGSPEVDFYQQAVEFAHGHMRDRISIVNSSVLGGIRGDYGDQHYTERTQGSELMINPLMGLYWTFDLAGVAERNLYLDRLLTTESMTDVWTAIERFRNRLPEIRAWKSLPF